MCKEGGCLGNVHDRTLNESLLVMMQCLHQLRNIKVEDLGGEGGQGSDGPIQICEIIRKGRGKDGDGCWWGQCRGIHDCLGGEGDVVGGEVLPNVGIIDEEEGCPSESHPKIRGKRNKPWGSVVEIEWPAMSSYSVQC